MNFYSCLTHSFVLNDLEKGQYWCMVCVGQTQVASNLSRAFGPGEVNITPVFLQFMAVPCRDSNVGILGPKMGFCGLESEIGLEDKQVWEQSKGTMLEFLCSSRARSDQPDQPPCGTLIQCRTAVGELSLHTDTWTHTLTYKQVQTQSNVHKS